MSPDLTEEIPAALRTSLGPAWTITVAGDNLEARHRDSGTPYRPPRKDIDWAELLERLQDAFAEYGVPRVPALPLRWRRETELTISAVQALDPYLKHRQPFVYGAGYLPQPVVRFTGRDADGLLRMGYQTSFVNISRVEPIKTIDAHATIFDNWIGVLSRLGLHARHVHLFGRLRIWHRPPVKGMTLRYNHGGLNLGDIVLLWNAEDPAYMATDLGTGLERLRWIITRKPWSEVVFGSRWSAGTLAQLDAIRTAVLLIGAGIAPAPRGPGSATRRVLRMVPSDAATYGLSAAVRAAHRFWSLTASGLLPWPEITRQMEMEVLGGD